MVVKRYTEWMFLFLESIGKFECAVGMFVICISSIFGECWWEFAWIKSKRLLNLRNILNAKQATMMAITNTNKTTQYIKNFSKREIMASIPTFLINCVEAIAKLDHYVSYFYQWLFFRIFVMIIERVEDWSMLEKYFDNCVGVITYLPGIVERANDYIRLLTLLKFYMDVNIIKNLLLRISGYIYSQIYADKIQHQMFKK